MTESLKLTVAETGENLAVTYTDWVQVSILFFGVAIIGIPVAVSQGGSWSTLTTSLPERYFDIGGWGWPTILALVVSVSLSFFTAMDNYTRCFAARSEQTARRGALIAAARSVVSVQTMDEKFPGSGRIASGPAGMKNWCATPLCGSSCSIAQTRDV